MSYTSWMLVVLTGALCAVFAISYYSFDPNSPVIRPRMGVIVK